MKENKDLNMWMTCGEKEEAFFHDAIDKDKKACVEALIDGGDDINVQNTVCPGDVSMYLRLHASVYSGGNGDGDAEVHLCVSVSDCESVRVQKAFYDWYTAANVDVLTYSFADRKASCC